MHTVFLHDLFADEGDVERRRTTTRDTRSGIAGDESFRRPIRDTVSNIEATNRAQGRRQHDRQAVSPFDPFAAFAGGDPFAGMLGSMFQMPSMGNMLSAMPAGNGTYYSSSSTFSSTGGPGGTYERTSSTRRGPGGVCHH